MKKMKKLLSVLLAMVMMLSCFSVLGYAYSSPENPGEWYYDSNDNPRAFLYTDEQRASAITDLVDGLLKSANIKMVVNIYIDKLNVDLTSLNAVADTIGDLKGYLGIAGGLLGMLGDLDFDSIDDSIETTDNGGAVAMLNMLLDFIEDNAGTLATNLIENGKIDLGSLINLGDMSAIEDFLKGLHKMVGGLVYGIGARQMTNGIGEDPLYPNTVAWADLTADEDATLPTLDAMLDNLIDKLLFQPNNTIRITDRSQNTLGAYALEEVAEDGTTYYYCYGVETDDEGNQTLITTYEGEEEPYRHYLTRWDENKALIKGESAEQLKAALDLRGKTLYDLLEDVIPWAYDAFAAHNLDAQLRATLMQFCGAFNNGDVDEATKEILKAKVDAYKAIEEEANLDKEVLRDTFAAETGAAGNVNFMYIDLEGNNINDKTSDSLYYVVEWGGSYQYYHVERDDVNALYDLIDWEYQAPMWATVASAAGLQADKSILAHINDIVGTILKTAMPSLAEGKANAWTPGTADGALANNLLALLKLVANNAKNEIWGEAFELPADFMSYDLEQALVMIASVLVPDLMPALVLPEDVSSLEEIIVYALRELMADMLPSSGADTDGSSWDDAIAKAKTEDDFLDIALSMGMSVGLHYLNNLIGVGTTGGDSNNNTVVATVLDLDNTLDWRTKLNYVIDWIRDAYLDRLDDNIVAKYPDAMNGSDPLLKLSAIFSALMPSFVKILGADDDTYAINLNTVYADLREILNGDFSGVAKGLMRDGIADDASGNKSAIQAIGTLIVELFGALGLEKASTWSNLKGMFTTAMADTSTPLTTLLGADWNSNAKIADLAEYLLIGLAEQRGIWLQNALTIVLGLLLGYEKEQAYTLSDMGVRTAYAGQATAQVTYDFELKVTGVRSYFNTGRYKTGDHHMDGAYSATVVEAKVFNSKGNLVTTQAISKSLGANEYTTVTVNVPAPEVPEVYTLVTYVRVKLPSQDTDVNNKPIEYKRQFIITSQENDSMTPVVTNFSSSGWTSNAKIDSGSNAASHNYTLTVNARYEVTSTYINESEPLSKAAETMFTLYANNTQSRTDSRVSFDNHTYTKFYMNNFGYSRTDMEEGKIKITDAADSTTLMDLTARTPMTLNGTSLNNTQLQNLWFKWNLNNSQPQTGFDSGREVSAQAPIWQVESGALRSDYTDDFYVYGVTAKDLRIEANYNAMSRGTTTGFTQESKGYSETSPNFTTYVVLYNSYGLEKIVDTAITYEKENYDTESAEGAAAWAAYESALNDAMSQLYGTWKAAQFAANHTTTADYAYTDEDGKAAVLPAGSSTFQLAGIKLEEAMEALADYVAEEDTGAAEEETAIYDPSNPADPYYEVYQLMQEQNAKKLHDDDWVLYRWFKYNDLYQLVNTALNNLTAPSETAPNTLTGVESDNEQIAKVIAALNNDALEAIVNDMVEAPTEEAQKAAEDAYNYFMENIEYHLGANPVDDLVLKAEQMLINGTPYAGNPATGRLLPVYDSNVYYWLEKAIDDYGNVTAADGYSANSFKDYADALAEAKAVLADAKANKSTQYEIFSARYEFLVAYKALILESEVVNVTTNGASGTEEDGLKALYAQAEAILAAISDDEVAATVDMNEDGVIDEADDALAYKQLVEAAGIPVESTNAWDEETTYYIGGDYTAAYAVTLEGRRVAATEQRWFDVITEDLDAALANFEAASMEPSTLMVKEDFEYADYVVIDTNNTNNGEYTGIVYGIDTLDQNPDYAPLATLADALTTNNGDDYLVITANESGMESTGATIEVIDEDGNVLETYVFVYFGDVDGDGYITSNDGYMAAYYEFAWEGLNSFAEYVACDADGDGMPTANDEYVMNYYEFAWEGVDYQYVLAEAAAANTYEWF